MKLNKILISMGIVLASVSTASIAAYTGTPTNGTIEFKGSLVNSACGLAANSSPVMVDFAEITTAALKNGARAGNEKKNIELQNCDITVAQHATVTYQPNTANPNDASLAAMLSGTAKGAGIGLTDNAGKDVVWGQASSPVNLTNGKSVIPFMAYVKADNSSSAVEPGDFTSQINFQIDYQ
ncbi:fimbrial protein [Pantoea coffeiphila]|uniref:Fimbrial protein n=1 Tax=Pantoea coffeiphila TaxID=1465635 RepID=A0A2S9I7B7_9GAMM|nr:fimbrial protein [Pantoea coffeiphila]PRD13697.1 fimbrial protein [Pantoea coffeiphila]